MEQAIAHENITRQTHVHFIGSIHYKLATNRRFTTEYLLNYIDCIDPDVIGVEISQQHMSLPQAELNRLYSPEFPAVKRAFEHSREVLPFNWMTKENEVDRSAFLAKTAALKQALFAAPEKQGEKELLRMLDHAIDVIADEGSAADVNSLAWDQLIDLKCKFETHIVQGTEFEADWMYYMGYRNPTRLLSIDHNVKGIIQTHLGKRIVILAGALHRIHTIPFLRRELPDIDLITEIRRGI